MYLFPTTVTLGLLVLFASAPVLEARETTTPVEHPGERWEVRQASTHPMRYWLALPEGYARQPGKKWPLLVILPGKATTPEASDPFLDTLKAYVQARARLPLILVVPITFLNNEHDLSPAMRARYQEYYRDMPLPRGEERLTWDEMGLLALRSDLLADTDAEERFYLTGFSAGGLLTYHFVLTHPELLAGVVTVCANFIDWGRYEAQPEPDARVVNFPVRIILGEKDPLRHQPSRTHRGQVKDSLRGGGLTACLGFLLWYWTRKWNAVLVLVVVGVLATGIWCLLEVEDCGNEAQAAQAEQLMRDFDYSDVQQTLLPGMGHDPSPKYVFEVFRPIWTSRRLLNASDSRSP